MKVKYFLRGLGMGILFSVVLLTFVGPVRKEALTDEEIVMRAGLLGMVKAEEGPVITQAPETQPPVPEAATETEDSEDSVEVKEPETTESPQEYVTLKIIEGMESEWVAIVLEDAGIISNAEAFNLYLCSMGYDDRISIGSFEIEKGDDFYEIAEKITK